MEIEIIDEVLQLSILFQPTNRLVGFQVQRSQIQSVDHLQATVMSFLEKIVDMGNPSQYVLAKSNYMPVDNLDTIKQNESLIVMPLGNL